MSTFASLALFYTNSIPGPDRETHVTYKSPLLTLSVRVRTYHVSVRPTARGAARAHVRFRTMALAHKA